jgi:hypothetical protein
VTTMRRRVTAPTIPRSSDPPRPDLVVPEATYRGYRIEPESYAVNSGGWSPRVVVSVRHDGGWARQPALYSTHSARFPSRDEADRTALDVARAWIDSAVARAPRCWSEPLADSRVRGFLTGRTAKREAAADPGLLERSPRILCR